MSDVNNEWYKQWMIETMNDINTEWYKQWMI